MSKIIDNIWLGGIVDVNNPGFHSKITHVINCTEKEIKYKMVRAEEIQLNLTDEEEFTDFVEVKNKLLRGARYLNSWNTADKNQMIMVHCMAGISRSPSVIIAYLMIYKQMTYDYAINLLSKRHGFIRPNKVYESVLRTLMPGDAESLSRVCSGNNVSVLGRSRRASLLNEISGSVFL